MEEIREEKIGQIMSWLQATARGKLSRQTYRKLQTQKVMNVRFFKIYPFLYVIKKTENIGGNFLTKFPHLFSRIFEAQNCYFHNDSFCTIITVERANMMLYLVI